MFCVSCGAKIKDGAFFCTSCGAKVKNGFTSVQNDPPEEEIDLDETVAASQFRGRVNTPPAAEPMPEADPYKTEYLPQQESAAQNEPFDADKTVSFGDYHGEQQIYPEPEPVVVYEPEPMSESEVAYEPETILESEEILEPEVVYIHEPAAEPEQLCEAEAAPADNAADPESCGCKYKLLCTSDDYFMTAAYNAQSVEDLLNKYAHEGWRVVPGVGMPTPDSLFLLEKE